MTGPTLTLNDDYPMPQLGLGTWQLPDAHAPAVVRDALDVGYRLVDTAAIYSNERGVGEGVHGAEAFIRQSCGMTAKGMSAQL